VISSERPIRQHDHVSRLFGTNICDLRGKGKRLAASRRIIRELDLNPNVNVLSNPYGCGQE